MNKNLLCALAVICALVACQPKNMPLENKEVDWSTKKIDLSKKTGLVAGKTYLSIYSQIQSSSKLEHYNLASMVSIRNTSEKDSIFIQNADYFDSHGKLLRSYFKEPIFLAPMETIEINIDQLDSQGGTGSNFIFKWKVPNACPEPIFEAVMSSVIGTQAMAFVTSGKKIE